MTPQLTPDNIIVLALVCSVIVFYAFQKALDGIVEYMIKNLRSLPSLSPDETYAFSRIIVAANILRFMTILVQAAAVLALVLYLFKDDTMYLFLPDRVLGFIILISYCGLVAVVAAIKEDILSAVARLFVP